MRSRSRIVAVVEALVLLLGSGLLVYVSCRDEEPDAPRESRVFSAARSAASDARNDGPLAGPSRALRETIGEWLREIATGRLTEEKRADLQNHLMHELEQAQIGKAEHRESAAGLIVQQVFDQAKREVRTPELSVRQVMAIDGMSRELTRQLLAVAAGSSPGADSIVAALPEGYEPLAWNQLGGFAYQEGSPLPPEVTALGDRKVGLPGFMLTLGSSEESPEFILVESLWGCCFGSVPDVNQTVIVRLARGQTASYTSGPILVTGGLRVGEEREGPFVTSLYRIENASVRSLDAEPAP